MKWCPQGSPAMGVEETIVKQATQTYHGPEVGQLDQVQLMMV